MLAEATKFTWLPCQLESLPLSEFQDFWSYMSIRMTRDDQSNPANYLYHQPIVDLIVAIFGEED